MIVANEEQTSDTHFQVGTSLDDGHMYLKLRGDDGLFSVKLTDENRRALAKVLGPTETWAGILKG